MLNRSKHIVRLTAIVNKSPKLLEHYNLKKNPALQNQALIYAVDLFFKTSTYQWGADDTIEGHAFTAKNLKQYYEPKTLASIIENIDPLISYPRPKRPYKDDFYWDHPPMPER